MRKEKPLSRDGFSVLVVQGHAAILERVKLYEEFAAQCDQPNFLYWSRLSLHDPMQQKKVLSLVLVLKPDAGGELRSVRDLTGIALFYECRWFGMNTGVLVADCVAARELEHGRVAQIAAREMLNRGGHSIMVSYDWPAAVLHPELAIFKPHMEWIRCSRESRQRFRLAETYETTLDTLGKTTRRNMRYYRRKLQAKVNCEYVPEATKAMSVTELLELNANSLRPIYSDSCRMRYGKAEEPEAYLAGLRGGDGSWLSVIGGWRQGPRTIVGWQTNRAGYEKNSLVTAMRAFFLENEVERGTTQLLYRGGTNHSMNNSFEADMMCDLYVRRRSVRGTLLRLSSQAVKAAISRKAGRKLLICLLGQERATAHADNALLFGRLCGGMFVNRPKSSSGLN